MIEEMALQKEMAGEDTPTLAGLSAECHEQKKGYLRRYAKNCLLKNAYC